MPNALYLLVVVDWTTGRVICLKLGKVTITKMAPARTLGIEELEKKNEQC